jgi:hypothetical protein
MSKLLQFIQNPILIICFFLLNFIGCVDVEYKLILNLDGSCDVSYRFLMNNMIYNLIGKSTDKDPYSDMKDSARNSGYLISNVVEGMNQGFLAQKHFSQLNDLINSKHDLGKFSNDIKIDLNKDLKISKTFFSTEYELSTMIDLSSLSDKSNSESAFFIQSMIQTMKFTFILGLPMNPSMNNASSIDSTGRFLTWQLIPGQKNYIDVKMKTWNFQNLSISVGLILLSVLGLGMMIWKKRL